VLTDGLPQGAKHSLPACIHVGMLLFVIGSVLIGTLDTHPLSGYAISCHLAYVARQWPDGSSRAALGFYLALAAGEDRRCSTDSQESSPDSRAS